MKAEEMWAAYCQINPEVENEPAAWQFGVEPDLLADLVLQEQKTATASSHDLYAYYGEDLPQVGSYDVVLDSQNEAVCIIETTKVEVLPFEQVSADHAFKEGEGDRSLAYWREVHEALFNQWLEEAGTKFSPQSKVVLEEFRLVYPHRQKSENML